MGKAARLARSGQGSNVVRGEAAGARVSRGTNRGRPLDVARDAREGDFIPLGPAAARRLLRTPTMDNVGGDTAQADNIANPPSGEVQRGEAQNGARSISDGTMIIGGKGRPADQIVVPLPTPFLPDPAPKARLSALAGDGSMEAAGVNLGNKPVLGASSNQASSGDRGAMGGISRPTRFTAK